MPAYPGIYWIYCISKKKKVVKKVVKRVLLYILVIGFILFPVTACTLVSAGVWEQLPLHGADIRSLALDSSNSQMIYAGTDGGVFKSSDGGANWANSSSGITNNHVQCLALDSSNSQMIYAGTYGGVFKSSDGGANWANSSRWLSDRSVCSLAIDPNNSQTLYAGTGGGVFKSTDGGDNWAASSGGIINTPYSYVACLAIDPNNSQTLYAGTGGALTSTYKGQVFKSSDGGANWANSSRWLSDRSVCSLAIDPNNSQTLYAGIDGGGYGRVPTVAPTGPLAPAGWLPAICNAWFSTPKTPRLSTPAPVAMVSSKALTAGPAGLLSPVG
jgi:ligand-binding sensor domain-containing protein